MHPFLILVTAVALAAAAVFFWLNAVTPIGHRGRSWFELATGGLILFAMSTGFAVAQTAAPAAPTIVHLDPTLQNEMVNFAAALLLALGLAAWKWIDAHSPLKNTQAEQILKTSYMDLLDKGAQYGATQLDAELTKVGDIDVGNAAVAAGTNFVMTHGPELAKRLGVDVTTPEGQAKIIQSMAARVGTLLGTAAANGDPIYKITMPVAALPSTTPMPVKLPTAPPAPSVKDGV